MAYPTFYPFKSRHYHVTTASSNQTVSVPIVARGRLVTAYLATIPTAAQTAAGTVDIAVNGTAVTGWSGVSITTSTGNTSTNLGSPTATSYVGAGDVLSTVASSVVGYSAIIVVQEF